MVKLYTSLVSFTLTASLALAVPHPSYNNGLEYSDLLERDLDEEFSGREYLLDAPDDLAAREPSFIGDFFKGAKKVAEKGIHVVEKVAENPLVQTAVSLVPGGGEVVAGMKVLQTVGKIGGAVKKAKQVEEALQKTRGIGKAIKTAKHLAENKKVQTVIKRGKQVHNIASKIQSTYQKGQQVHQEALQKTRGIGKAIKAAKHLAENKKVQTVIKRGKQVHNIASMVQSGIQKGQQVHQKVQQVHQKYLQFKQRRQNRNIRRDLEDYEEQSSRGFDDEELFGREYDDILAERDFFDDLD